LFLACKDLPRPIVIYETWVIFGSD